MRLFGYIRSSLTLNIMHKWITLVLLLFPVLCFGQTHPGKLGVNLGDFEFVDAMKSSGSWSPITGNSLSLDSNGWPKQDARIVVFDVRPFGTWAPPADDPEKKMPDVSGTYKLSFNGTAVLSSWGDPFNVMNQSYNSATNTTTADLIFRPSSGLLLINFEQTHAGVSNVSLRRPGYAATTSSVFRRELFDALCPFSATRYMNWTNTNNDVPVGSLADSVTHWRDRKHTYDATQNAWGKKRDGIAWEYIIELANESMKDAWINIPVAADDDYVTSLAALFKTKLDPHLKIYIEYSNEVWNGGFPQFKWNRDAAMNEIAKGNSNLNKDGQTFDRYLAARRVARRLKEIGDLFKTVYGDNSFGTTIRPVLASQVSWPELIKQGLSFIETTYGAPQKYFYAVAGAPYFSGSLAPKHATVNEIVQSMRASSDSSRALRNAYAEIASTYQLPLFAYEGGPDNGGGDTTNIANRILANRDSAMGAAVTHDLTNNWYPLGGDLFMYFTLNGNSSRYGCWGAIEDITKPATPKYLALKSISGLCAARVKAEVIDDESIIHLTPNPAANSIVINSAAKGPAVLRVIDALGRTCRTRSYVEGATSTILLDISALSEGVYFIELSTSSEFKRAKFILKR
jgi:hypothetical protein